MSNRDDFQRFLAWADRKGYDTANTYDSERNKYVCLNPALADAWEAWTESKYTPSSNVEGREAVRELVRAACLQERQPTEGHQRAYVAARDAVMRLLPQAQPERKWDEFGRTNEGDETGGAVQRFGFDISGRNPDIIPATNGAFVHYSDYLALYCRFPAQPSAQGEAATKEQQA